MSIKLALNMDLDMTTSYKSTRKADGKTDICLISHIEIDPGDFEKRMKVAAIISQKTLGEIAENMGTSQANLLIRCRNGKMSFEEQRKLAAAIGCNIVIKCVFEDGTEFFGVDSKSFISDICSHVDISKAELANQLGMSRQNFFSRITNGKLSKEDLDAICEKVGGTYMNYFEFPDGTMI